MGERIGDFLSARHPAILRHAEVSPAVPGFASAELGMPRDPSPLPTHMNQPTIRPALPADLPWLLALTPRLAEFPVPAWRTPGEIARADHAILEAAVAGALPDSVVLVAKGPTGLRLGYAFSTTRRDYFTGEPHAHLEVLVVDPAGEGQGIARALVAATEAWARARGMSQVTLNVFATNERARGLYAHLGYLPETIHYIKRL
jgi:ribosomal protein S18 acetylase RimI-like enzyme